MIMTIALMVLLIGASSAMTVPGPTTTEAIDTTTPEKVIDCSSFRSHPTDPHKFQSLDRNNVYADESCFGPLFWNQTLCRCVSGPCEDDDPHCEGHRGVAGNAQQFERCVWGVWQVDSAITCPINQIWNQSSCRCDWDPLGPRGVFHIPVANPRCGSIFNATFDKSIRDEGINQYSIGRDPWVNIKLDQNVEGAVGGGAVRANRGGLPLWFTSGNDLGDTFQIQLRFKVVDNGQSNVEDVSLLSNTCGHDRTTLSIRYGVADQSYSVFFRNRTSPGGSMECTAPSLSPFDFHDLSLEYKDNFMVLKIDGEQCVSSNEFRGRILVTMCHLTLGGMVAGSGRIFDGYFDEVVFRRGCIEAV